MRKVRKILILVFLLLFVGCTYVTPKVSVRKTTYNKDSKWVKCEVYCCYLYKSSRSDIKGFVKDCIPLGICSDNETKIKEKECIDFSYNFKEGVYELQLDNGNSIYSLEWGWRNIYGQNVIAVRRISCQENER